MRNREVGFAIAMEDCKWVHRGKVQQQRRHQKANVGLQQLVVANGQHRELQEGL